MPIYGPLSPAEHAALPPPPSVVKTVDYERFCEAHPYRVVGPDKPHGHNQLPDRRFSTLICAARTVLSEGPKFRVECGEFKTSFAECVKLVAAADFNRAMEYLQEKP